MFEMDVIAIVFVGFVLTLLIVVFKFFLFRDVLKKEGMYAGGLNIILMPILLLNCLFLLLRLKRENRGVPKRLREILVFQAVAIFIFMILMILFLYPVFNQRAGEELSRKYQKVGTIREHR